MTNVAHLLMGMLILYRYGDKATVSTLQNMIIVDIDIKKISINDAAELHQLGWRSFTDAKDGMYLSAQ